MAFPSTVSLEDSGKQRKPCRAGAGAPCSASSWREKEVFFGLLASGLEKMPPIEGQYDLRQVEPVAYIGGGKRQNGSES